nr:probable 2-carboxy-D-arabinitol-1-phosphatase [Ipomoea batatas]
MSTCRALVTCPYFPRTSTPNSKKSSKIHAANSGLTCRVLCSTSTPELPTTTTEKVGNDIPLTGSAYDFYRAMKSLTQKALSSPKKVTLVRHGFSTWNEEGRVQGSSNLSVLTEQGVMQAHRCRKAIEEIHFDQCFASPISRAKSTAEIIWQGSEQPLVFLDSLKEAHLYFLEGMKNGLCVWRQRMPSGYTRRSTQRGVRIPLISAWMASTLSRNYGKGLARLGRKYYSLL